MQPSTLFFALMANLSFSIGSLIFASFSRSLSPLWVNASKCFVAFVCFALTIQFTDDWHSLSFPVLSLFLMSGFIGLNIGDLFMLKAFAQIGPPRTLILFGIQPIVIAILALFFLNQGLDLKKLISIGFFILCLLLFAYENYKQTGSWKAMGILFALVAILLDASGIIMTRMAFDRAPQLTTFEGNFYRCLGAGLGFIMTSRLFPIQWIEKFQSLSTKNKLIAILGCFLGTYLSLGFYLQAVKSAHLATLSALSITAPILAAVVDCFYSRQRPSIYLLVAFPLFITGVFFLAFY